MQEHELLTIKQTAEYLQVTRAQVYKFFKRKNNPLPYVNLTPTARRIKKEDLETWIANQEVKRA